MLSPNSQQLPVQDICRHFSLRNARDGDWLGTPGIQVALHPDRSCIAISHQNEVAVFTLNAAVPDNQDAHALCPSTIGSSSAAPASHSISNTEDGMGSLFSSISRALHRSSSSSSSRRQQQEGSLLGCAATSDADITCMTWVVVRPASASATVSTNTRHDLARQSETSLLDTSDASWLGPGAQAVSEPGSSNVEAAGKQQGASRAVLLTGDAGGYIQIHDSQGHAVFRQRLHVQALQHISMRFSAQGPAPGAAMPSCSSSSDGHVEQLEFTITGVGCVIQVGYQQLLRTWHACEVALAQRHDRQQQQASGSMFANKMLSWLDEHSTPQIPPLQCQRWELPRALQLHGRAVCVGNRAPDLYLLLREMHNASNAPIKSVIVAGSKPCLAGVELRPAGGRSTLGAALGAGISIASGLFSAARMAGSTVVNGPSAITQGIRSFVMAPLFAAPRPAKASPTLLVTHTDPAAGLAGPQLPHLASMWGAYHDSPRSITSLTTAPVGGWVAATDNLGRVLLVDAVTLMVVRTWKGYRDAVCAWLQLPPDERTIGHSSTEAALPTHIPALVVYAPKCNVVHVWLVPCGTCIASIPTATHCKLLHTTGGSAGRMHTGLSCFLLDGTTGQLRDVALLACAALHEKA